MQKYSCYLIIFILILPKVAGAQKPFSWPAGTEAAVILTYDDAMDSQLNTALPQLNKAGLKATFYLSPASENVTARLSEWRQASQQGHELANHTLHHPCRKSTENNWVHSDYDLRRYSLNRYVNEVKLANTLLFAIDGKKQRTFAYTCGHLSVGENVRVVEAIQPLVMAARSVSSDGFNNPMSMKYFEIRAQDASGRSGAQLIRLVEQAKAKNQMLVLLFHDVGGEHLSIDAGEHQILLNYLQKNSQTYWVSTLRDAVTYVNKSR